MKFIKNLYYLISGFITFAITKKNSEKSYQAFVKIYSITNGLSNIVINFTFLLFDKISFLKKNNKFLPNINEVIIDEDPKKISIEINKNSYFEFSKKLDNKICTDILDYISEIDGYGNRDVNNKVRINNKKEDVNFINYWESDLLKNKNIQKLSVNKKILDICKYYFGTDPVLTNIGVAVTYPTNEPRTEYAQLYHFDLDRTKWLKFFIYLKDVSLENGPHKYIEGTHKVFSKPYELVKKGYVRVNDQDFFKYYEKSQEKIFVGSQGSMIVGDTLAFHKGVNPSKGFRIMLQLEYASSLFGAQLENTVLSEGYFDNKTFLVNNIKKSKLFSKFIFI